jgi:hypothetical protein
VHAYGTHSTWPVRIQIGPVQIFLMENPEVGVKHQPINQFNKSLV